MESFPVSFRVICVGEELSGVFRSIFSMGFDGVLVQSTTMFPNPTPSEEDKMVILLTKGRSPLFENIAKSFYQAGVLTLIISTELIETKETICDAQTVSSIESMYSIVKGLLNPLLKPCLIAYDFHDMYVTLHNAGSFKMIESSSELIKNRIDDAISKFSTKTGSDIISHVENATIIIYYNRNTTEPLSVSEFNPLTDYLTKMPEDISVIWAVIYDDDMPTNEVRLEAILSGKNMEL